jgi:enterobactin synthetase component D
MLGSSTLAEGWIEPPLVVRGDAYGSATTAVDLSSGATRREREFAAGRRCAARALRQAGSAKDAVRAGPDRKPIWPSGFVGSITHSATLAWAVATTATRLRSVGIDSEPIFDASALRDAARLALDEPEWQLARAGQEAERATLMFSAKESLFKCLNPCIGEFFQFTDVRFESMVPKTDRQGTFELRLLRDLAEFSRGRRFAGQYAIARNHVHTAVELLP